MGWFEDGGEEFVFMVTEEAHGPFGAFRIDAEHWGRILMFMTFNLRH